MADTLIYTSEKTLKDAGDKVSADTKKPVEEKISTLKEALKTDNIEDIKNKTQELSGAIQKVGAELYKANPKDSGPQDTPPTPENEINPKSEDEKNEPKAEEGEYKEKK